MENGYSRQDFQTQILYAVTSGIQINGKNIRTTSEALGVGIVFATISGVLLVYLLYSLFFVPKTIEFNNDFNSFIVFATIIEVGITIVSTIITIGFFYIGLTKIIQAITYRSLTKYYDLKESLLLNIEFIKKITLINSNDEDIILELDIIKKSLDEVTKAYKFLLTPLIIINNYGRSFSPYYRNKLSNFIQIEKLWLYEYIVYSNKIVNNWIISHTQELIVIKKNIEKQSTEEGNILNISKVLSLASNRLDSHIINLEKIQLKII